MLKIPTIGEQDFGQTGIMIITKSATICASYLRQFARTKTALFSTQRPQSIERKARKSPH